jgi:hypothetical protein
MVTPRAGSRVSCSGMIKDPLGLLRFAVGCLMTGLNFEVRWEPT